MRWIEVCDVSELNAVEVLLDPRLFSRSRTQCDSAISNEVPTGIVVGEEGRGVMVKMCSAFRFVSANYLTAANISIGRSRGSTEAALRRERADSETRQSCKPDCKDDNSFFTFHFSTPRSMRIDFSNVVAPARGPKV